MEWWCVLNNLENPTTLICFPSYFLVWKIQGRQHTAPPPSPPIARRREIVIPTTAVRYYKRASGNRTYPKTDLSHSDALRTYVYTGLTPYFSCFLSQATDRHRHIHPNMIQNESIDRATVPNCPACAMGRLQTVSKPPSTYVRDPNTLNTTSSGGGGVSCRVA